ncbi:phage tail assembly chaperone G [Staphylococcus equorum]|uniref:phage tail assembly chaperone G n=1 Tax=Staphylococcus equorum TaxID=246432 RepID=UPI003EBAF1F8
MAKQTKLHFIELIKDIKEDGEVETKVYFTPKFIPFSKLIEITDKLQEIEKVEESDKENEESETETIKETEKSETETIKEMFKLVAEDIYNNQFTAEELMDGLHAPEAIKTVQEQIAFISEGKVTEDNEKRLKQLLK